jgi:hypothetical protein
MVAHNTRCKCCISSSKFQHTKSDITSPKATGVDTDTYLDNIKTILVCGYFERELNP